MSAVIRAYTLDGFVVFADGRSTPEGSDKPTSDEAQKIFDVSSDSGPLSMAIVGTVQIEASDGLCVDWAQLFRDSANTLCALFLRLLLVLPRLILHYRRFGNLQNRSECPVEPFHRGIPLRLGNREFCSHLVGLYRF